MFNFVIALLKTHVFLVVTPCILIKSIQCLEGS